MEFTRVRRVDMPRSRLLATLRSGQVERGELEERIDLCLPGALERATLHLYTRLFDLIDQRSLFLVRVWNFVPQITRRSNRAAGAEPRYHEFNAGRYRAFRKRYGEDPADWPIPAASAVGTGDDSLRIEFLASDRPPVFLENKSQVPARKYSRHYGDLPPLFARGALYSRGGQRILISSGTASVVGEESRHAGSLAGQVQRSIQNLRILVSQFNLKPHGIHFGFGLEDLVLLRAYYKRPEDLEAIRGQLRATLDPDCELVFRQADICREELLVELEGVFLKKGEYAAPDRKKYRREDGRVRVESLEIHVTEHCNLRCRGCDAMSPYNPARFLPVDDAERVVRMLARHIRADAFKLMGGEPTLHPGIVDLLRIARESGIGRVCRLTTNGLLLHRMPDAFWKLLDRLTISNYSSRPMTPEQVAQAEEKARRFNVVLNLKWIDEFNRVMLTEPLEDEARVRGIYQDCWIRHRSLVARDGWFFKCTRAAYMNDFRVRLALPLLEGDESDYTLADGLLLDAPGFADRLLEYLNSPEPLASCRYCLGASGELLPHRQLTRVEIAAGVV